MTESQSRLGTFGFLLLCEVATGASLFAGGNPIAGLAAEAVVAGIFLEASIISKRSARWTRFREVFYALFVSSSVIALRTTGIGLVSIAYNPSSIAGQVSIAIVDFFATVATIVVLIRASGRTLSSLYLRKGDLRLGLLVGLPAFLVLFLGITVVFQLVYAAPRGIPIARVLAILPLVLFAITLNAPKEELWFRGLLIGRFEPLLGLRLSNLLQAIVFTVGHIEPQWIQFGQAFLVSFVLLVFVAGLGFGLIVQRTKSILGSSLAHAGADVGVFLLLLSPFLS